MMKRIYVTPAAGLYVPDAHDIPYPAEGREVNLSTHVSRLIKEGALIVGTAAQQIEATEKTEEKQETENDSEAPEWKPVARKKRG